MDTIQKKNDVAVRNYNLENNKSTYPVGRSRHRDNGKIKVISQYEYNNNSANEIMSKGAVS